MSEIVSAADLPGARLTALKAWAAPIPDWSAIPVGRRTTVVDSGNLATNATNLQTALDAARLQTGGDRLVILPDNFQCRAAATFGVNADLLHDIIVVPQRVVDGTYPLTRYVRVPASRPSWVPRLFTKDAGTAGFQDTLITTAFSPAAHRWRVFCVDLRVYTLAATNDEAFALVDHGHYGTAVASGFPDPALCAGYLQLSHCWTGGVAFDAAGKWRPNNLDRFLLDSSTGCAINDSYNSEHGSAGGSDSGFWDSIISQGPVWIHNVGGDSFGGIAYMSGGSDVPSSFPNCADFEIAYSLIDWNGKYANPGIGYPVPGTAMQDTTGAYCPWAHKNQGEIKQALRHRWRRNVYRGFWQSGQVGVIGIKANQQSGSGRLDATDHVTIEECIIDPFDCEFGIGLIPVSADPGFHVDPIGHATIRNNYIRSPKTFITLSPHIGTTAWAIHNNLYDPLPGHTYYGPFFSNMTGSLGAEWLGLSGLWQYCRNAYAGTPYYPDASFAIEGGAGTAGYGYGPYWAQMQTGGALVTCADNVIPVPAVPPDYGAYTTNLHPANVAALGLTRGANGLYQHNVGSLLLTAAAGGTERAGPDLALISAIYDAVIAGDVRALVAAEEAPVVPGVVTQLVFDPPPTGVVANSAFGCTVKAKDAAGTVVTGFTGQVRLFVAIGRGQLTGTLVLNAVAGVATFSGLKLRNTRGPVEIGAVTEDA